MPSRRQLDIPLPRDWTHLVRSATLHAIALASMVQTIARGRAATRSGRRNGHGQPELDEALTEIALLREELTIKDNRWERVPSRRRPHYSPHERLRILQLRAARGWTCEATADRFLVDEQTLRSWVGRVDEEGERALVRLSAPVNRFPDFVRYLVLQLKVLLPSMGKVRIAQVLARAGLHLSATTVGRILTEPRPRPQEALSPIALIAPRRVTARRPHHVWHLDLTTIPTTAGFWVPWLPFARPQSWPFCWWVAVIVDHFSRAVVGFAVFRQCPASAEVWRILTRAIRHTGEAPKHLITDRGRQFSSAAFRQWCGRRHIRHRFGAVGQYGSLAVIERFIRSLKDECTSEIVVPVRLGAVRRELGWYAVWYNHHRPGQALRGRTPAELYRGLRPANARSRFEPRADWPRRSRCAAPQAPIRGGRGAPLSMTVSYLEGRRHLPVVRLRKAA